MRLSDTYVRARIDSETKEKAMTALDSMGITVSDAIRIFLKRIAEEKRFPLELRAPNKTTLEAMREAGDHLETFETTEGLMEWLNEEEEGDEAV